MSLFMSSGFKCEWGCVKDQELWFGGLGKEWTTTSGVVQHLNPQWVKSVGHIGDVLHHDWVDNYNVLRKKGGFMPPGRLLNIPIKVYFYCFCFVCAKTMQDKKSLSSHTRITHDEFCRKKLNWQTVGHFYPAFVIILESLLIAKASP